VGAPSPWPSLVGLCGEESRSPCRRHRALWARAPSDLFGPHLRRVRNRDPERNPIRAAWRRHGNSGILHKGATRGTLPTRRTRPRHL
jgi:hypothetical protein